VSGETGEFDFGAKPPPGADGGSMGADAIATIVIAVAALPPAYFTAWLAWLQLDRPRGTDSEGTRTHGINTDAM